MKSTFKTIIFDVGNVLLHWCPLKTVASAKNERHDISNELVNICSSPLWQEFDRGALNSEHLIDHFSTIHHPAHLESFFRHAPEVLTPLEEGVELLNNCLKQGYQVYILSNMPWETRNFILSRFPFLHLPHGAIYSCEVGHVKPERKIYEILLDKYQINPHTALFLDDRQENLHSAKELGISGVLVDDYPRCLDELRQLRILE